jgi:hypothetical protein
MPNHDLLTRVSSYPARLQVPVWIRLLVAASTAV